MSYAIDKLPDLSPLGGHWSIVTRPDIANGRLGKVGRAHFPDVEWPFEPDTCPYFDKGAWYLDGTLLICQGCGCDGT